MSNQGFHLYPRIKCPWCKFHTTNPASLGIHEVDKHGDQVLRGVIKIRSKGSGKPPEDESGAIVA